MFLFYLIAVVLLSAGMTVVRNRQASALLVLLFLGLQTLLPVYGYYHMGQPEAGGYFRFDPPGILFLGILTLLSYTTLFHSSLYLRHRQDSDRSRRLYLAALMLLIGAMTSVYLAASLGILWVVVELTTLSVAALIYHERSHLALEATWKYVFICTIGITFAFAGSVFLSKALRESGSVNLSFTDIPAHLQQADSAWLKLAFIFMLVGFSTKMGLFPMHTITVDAHTVAPPPISAFISTTLMNAGFVAIFRTYSLIAHTAILPWMNQVLLWSGMLSVFVSAVYILKATHLKRMFAYSSLEQMGITAVGLAMGGIGIFAALLHITLHSFVKAAVFYQIDQVHRVYHTYLIGNTGGYFRRNFAGAWVILLVFVSITAIPPSGMFVSEILVFRSMLEAREVIALVVLLLLTLILYALGKNLMSMLFSRPGMEAIPGGTAISPWESATQIVLLALAMYLGFNPPPLLAGLIRDTIALLP